MSTFPSPHIVVVAFPFGFHAAPLLTLTTRLAAAMPAATFSFLNTAKSNSTIADAVRGAEALGNVRAAEVPDGYVFQGRPQEKMGLFIEAAPALVRGVVERLDGPAVTAVICDAFIGCAGEMAEEWRLPWVSVWTSSAISLVALLHTRRLRQIFDSAEIETKMDAPLDAIPGLSKCRVRDLPEGIIFGDLNSVFHRMLARVSEASTRAAAIVINSFEGIEPEVSLNLPARSLLIPLTLLNKQPAESPSDPHGCLPFLYSSATPAVYIAFGSVTALPGPELAILAEALEATPYRFLWSLSETKQKELPDGFMERTKEKGVVVPWAPQSAVLAHPATGAFFTHCGMNLVMESVAAGVPLVCRPLFGDQRLNGRTVTTMLGVGVEVDGGRLSKDGVLKALEAVMVGEEGRKMREKVGLLKATAAAAVSEGGRSAANISKLVDILSATIGGKDAQH